MNRIAPALEGLYSQLLRLYPARFREEFGEEMRTVFARVVQEAGQEGTASLLAVCFRELLGLAFSLASEYRLLLRRGGITMSSTESIHEPVSGLTRRDAYLAVLPFAAFGFSMMLSKILPAPYYSIPFVLTLIFSLAGLYYGAMSGFPRWAYSFLGWAATLSLLWTMFRFSNNPLLAQLLSCVGLLPFILMLAIPVVRQRSFEPLRQLFRGIWKDWTNLTLSLFSFAGYVLLIYDENHHPYVLAFIAASTLTICAGIWFFMRSRSTRGRVGAIVATFAVALTIVTICDSTWDAAAYYSLPPAGPQSWSSRLLGGMQMLAVWAVMMFWPAVIGLLRRITHPDSGSPAQRPQT